MTFIFRIIIAFFIMENPLNAALHHNDFKGLSEVIEKDLSPVRGKILLLTSGISNIRFFMENSEDPYFRLVKMLFPSNGGTLSTTAQTTYNFGKNCTSPATVAELIKFAKNIIEKRSYSLSQKEQVIVRLAKDSPHQKSNLKKYKRHTLSPLLLAIENVINAPEYIKSFYKDITATDIIHAFFCFHFNTRADLFEYIQTINGNYLIKDRFSLDEFETLQGKSNPVLEEQLFLILSNLSEKSPYPKDEVLISNDNCPAFDRATGHYIDKKFFADCVETAIRHFLNILFFDSSSRSFQINHIEQTHRSLFFENLEEFYSWQSEDKANDGSQDLRGLFNKITGDLNDNEYSISYRKKNKYNIRSGFINFVSVLNRIFNIGIDINSINKNNLDEALELILQVLARQKNYSVHTKNLSEKNAEIYGKFILDMGDDDTFTIDISEYHTEANLSLASINDEENYQTAQFSNELIHLFASKNPSESSYILGKLADDDAKIIIIARLLQHGPHAWGEHRNLITHYLGGLLFSLSWSDGHVQELFEQYIAQLLNSLSTQNPDIAARLLGFVQHTTFAYSKGLNIRLLPMLHGLKKLVIEDGELLESILIDGKIYTQLKEIKLDTHSDSIVDIKYFDGCIRFTGNAASSISLSHCRLKELKAADLSIENGRFIFYDVAINKSLSCDGQFLDIADPQLDLSELKNCIISSNKNLHIPVLPALNKLEIKIKMPCLQKEPMLSFGNGLFEKLQNINIALEHPWVRCEKPKFSMHLDSGHMPALESVKNQNIYPHNFSWINCKAKELPCCQEVNILSDDVCDITMSNAAGNFSCTTTFTAHITVKNLMLLKNDAKNTIIDLSAFKKIVNLEIVGGGILENLTIVGLQDCDRISCTSMKRYEDSIQSIIIKDSPFELQEKIKNSILCNKSFCPSQITFLNETL